MPSPILLGTTYYLRLRVPTNLLDSAKGTNVVVPIGETLVTTRVGEVVKVSLRTKDAAVAKRRFIQAIAAVEAHWITLRNGPVKLSHKQCVGLAGEVRRDWISAADEDPGDPDVWRRVKALDAEAKQLKQRPERSLMVGSNIKPTNLRGLEQRFGGLVDVALRRRQLVVDNATRTKLLQLIAEAMAEAVEINLKKAEGDYSDTGQTTKYPEFFSPSAATAAKSIHAPPSLSFSAIIDEEVRRRSLGREGKPLPERTARKYRIASKEFADFRDSANSHTVTPEEVEGWKLDLLEEGVLTNNTISQRLQNLSTVMEWGQQHTLGKLFANKNPFSVVKRPEKLGVRSEERTLRLEEARAILRAARKEELPTLRWLPWLMAYSGARVSEVAQLSPSDFFIVEGLWFFQLTTKGRKTLKNEHSVRKVPIHPDLIAEGLLDFVGNRRQLNPEDRLFKRSAQQELSVWVRTKVSVTREEAAPNHGWRHLFEDKALDAGMISAAKLYVTGRAKGKSEEGYGKSEAMLPALAREIAKVRPYL